jgi:hypothetical protein
MRAMYAFKLDISLLILLVGFSVSPVSKSRCSMVNCKNDTLCLFSLHNAYKSARDSPSMKQARMLPVRSLANSQWTKGRAVRLLSSTAARLQVTPHEQQRPPASHSPASTTHEQQSSRARWTRERASTAEHPEGDGSFTGQGSMIDTALGIALGTAMLGCGGIAYFQWCVSASRYELLKVLTTVYIKF